MNNILDFLINLNLLKGKRRRGWHIHDIENGETTAEHIFHLIFLVWIIGEKRDDIDTERAIKIAMVHDICEAYAPDLTSYDALSIKEGEEINREELGKNIPEKGRPTTEQRKRLQEVKEKLEEEGLIKLIKPLQNSFKDEIFDLWQEYEKGITAEGRFVKQADKLINLLQGMEYYKKYGKIEHELWIRRGKEVIDDPSLLELLGEIEKKIE